MPFHTWFQANPFAGFLLLLMIADVVTGVLVAFKTRSVASDISRDGLTRKAGMLIIVGVAKIIDSTFLKGLPISEMIAAGYCGSEGFSLIENAGRLNAPVPRALTQFFAKLRESSEEDPRVR